MDCATHLYAYVAKTSRPRPRIGTTATGRFQVCGEIDVHAAKHLIADMNHGSLGEFEILELKLLRVVH